MLVMVDKVDNRVTRALDVSRGVVAHYLWEDGAVRAKNSRDIHAAFHA